MTDITPQAGLPMGGYGARNSPAVGTHDPLMARVLVLSDGETEVALVICDVVGAPRLLVDHVRQGAQALGLEPEHVMVMATHTHSGPSVVYSRRLNDYLLETAAAAARCIEEARRMVEPVELRAATAPLETLSQNRRDPDGPIQREAAILCLSEPDRGSIVATLINYACHPTVLEHDNLEWSADFPGAACRFVEQSLGGVALYLQGCCGDINPLWVEHDFAELERIGQIVGAATVRAVQEVRPVGTSGQFGINLSWSESIRQDPSTGAVIEDAKLAASTSTVELRKRPLGSLHDVEAEISGLQQSLKRLEEGSRARRELMPRLNQLNMERTVLSYPQLQPPEVQEVEVQAIALGSSCAIVALPGEFFAATRESLLREAGVEHLVVAGYANDYIGYVPPADEFLLGGYEVGFARFRPESEALVRSAALESLRRVTLGVPA